MAVTGAALGRERGLTTSTERGEVVSRMSEGTNAGVVLGAWIWRVPEVASGVWSRYERRMRSGKVLVYILIGINK